MIHYQKWVRDKELSLQSVKNVYTDSFLAYVLFYHYKHILNWHAFYVSIYVFIHYSSTKSFKWMRDMGSSFRVSASVRHKNHFKIGRLYFIYAYEKLVYVTINSTIQSINW